MRAFESARGCPRQTLRIVRYDARVMKTFRLGTLALPALGSALLISSCIADGDTTSAPPPSEAGAAGAHAPDGAGAGNTPEGGSAGASDEMAAGAAGRETTEGGGSGGASDRGGTGNAGSDPAHAGESGVTGGAAGAHDFGGQTGAGASGGVPGGGGEPASGEAGSGGREGIEPLALCLRLTSPTGDAFDVATLYWQATTGDCRISWVSRLYGPDEVQTFLNGLLRWNRAFWGCLGTEPPENFGLMYVEVPATSADTEILIDHYMDAAISTLELSPDEIDAMRRHLELLAKRVIERETDELSNATCVEGAGGDGGQP